MGANAKKKGSSGQAKNFMTRSQAVRKLQIALPDFRRLCIFKGIYPREPRNKKKVTKATNAVFYYSKDIAYLLHEPLIAKFREHNAVAKKVSKALGRGEVKEAAKLEKHATPRISLDKIVKERYPTFQDALRDLDDCLSMLSLFANLPSTSNVPPKTIALCQRLYLEFQHYLILTRSLHKSFLSVKGIYYSANIMGHQILWVQPYRFVPRMTSDVDFRIMGTFIEFYTTLLGFVNYRLYTAINLVYPPKFSAKSDEQGGELGALTLEGKGIHERPRIEQGSSHSTEVTEPNDTVQQKVDAFSFQTPEEAMEDSLEETAGLEDPKSDVIDTFQPTTAGGDILPQPSQDTAETSTLFEPFTFFLSRETPRQPLEFLLRAFGCKRVGWDEVLGDGAFTKNERDSSITHQIVDRPPTNYPSAAADGADSENGQSVRPGSRMPGRTYVQPQWVFDSSNEGKLLRPDLYAPGATLPPHLSPWVKPKKGSYDPTASLAEQEREGEAELAEEELSEPEYAEDNAVPGLDKDETGSGDDLEMEDHGMDTVSATNDSESAAPGVTRSRSPSFSGFDSDVSSADIHQRELEAEAAGLSFKSSTKTQANKPQSKSILKKPSMSETARREKKRREEEAEELERRKMMMGSRKRKVLEKMLHGNTQKEKEAEKLRRKRRKLEGHKEGVK